MRDGAVFIVDVHFLSTVIDIVGLIADGIEVSGDLGQLTSVVSTSYTTLVLTSPISGRLIVSVLFSTVMFQPYCLSLVLTFQNHW